MLKYFVDGKEFHSESNQLTLREILQNAGLLSDDSYLVSDSGKEFHQFDETITLNEGEKFEVKRDRSRSDGKPINYEVNGELQTTNESALTVEAILKNAGRKAGIDPNEPEKYRLDNLATDKKYNDPSELVPIHNGDKFVAIYTSVTPVA